MIKKSIKNKTNYIDSFKDDISKKKIDEKSDSNIIDIISFNKNNNKRNRISLLRKVNNSNNVDYSGKKFHNTNINEINETNNNNQKMRTTEIMITTDILQINNK